MASQSSPLCVLPPSAPIKDNNVHLMPFGVGYTGSAPLSTFWMIRDAPEPIETDAKGSGVSDAVLEDADASLTRDAESHIPVETMSVETSDTQHLNDQPNGPAIPLLPSSQLPNPPIEPEEKKFLSAFRGRALHGLEVPLPEGYSGIVLSVVGETSTRNEKETSETDKGKRKGNGADARPPTKVRKLETGDDTTRSRGRMTRSKSQTVVKPKDDVNAEEVQVAQEEERQLTPSQDEAMEDGVSEMPARGLVPVSAFSSLTVWNADNPVDTGRDEYIRSLDEWTRLSSLIHEI
ncbi:hypothetical protein FRB95_012219 [Tulasnella sp. JGI-2019a]|nr:hypothetical protein FRB95_012219 [Tulasnella sp. JGI-2019a]